MPQQYQDPIASLIDGMLQAHGLAMQMHRQKQEDEAFARKSALEDQESSIKDIMNRMQLQNVGRPVEMGVVNLPGMSAPDNSPELGLPNPNQAPSYARKADRSRTVKYKDRTGNTSEYELYTPEEQAQRGADAASEAEFRKQADVESAKERTRRIFGQLVPDDINEENGYAPGTRHLSSEIPPLTKQARASQKERIIQLADGAAAYDTQTGKIVANNPKEPPQPTGDFRTVYLPAFAAKLGKTVDKLDPNEVFQAFQQHATDTKDPATLALAQEMTKARLEQMRTNAAGGMSKPIEPGTREYRLAQDLAYGKTTLTQFRTMFGRSTNDTNRRLDIYDKAAELNPNFNPAQFEMGFTFAKNPKVQQQLASLDNVQQGIPDLLKFSDRAKRAGATVLNKFLLPGGIAIGNKKYSNFRTAQIAFADELSGALGYGSATDMSREMGFNMADPNLGPDAFNSAIQDVVLPFIERKRATMLKQMGVYGLPGMNPAASTGAPARSGALPQVGDVVTAGGKKVKITAIHDDGSFDADPVK